MNRDQVEGMPYNLESTTSTMADGTPIIELQGFCITFDGESFGHASTFVGPWTVPDLKAAFEELQKARARLKIELEKKKRGEEYDFFFVHGVRKEDGWQVYEG